jgi:hypothetical protein
VIPFLTLDDKEVVYTWENPDEKNTVRMWCVNRMEDWCRETNRQVFHSQVDSDRAEWFIANRGIEQHRIDLLLQNPERCLNPCMMMRINRGTVLDKFGAEPWDLMLDGHHRYVALAIMQMPAFKLWHLSEEEAKQFEVSGVPQPKNGLNVFSFSGLGMDR